MLKFLILLIMWSNVAYSEIVDIYTGERIESRGVNISIDLPEGINRDLLTAETMEFNSVELSTVVGEVFNMKVPEDNEMLCLVYYESDEGLMVVGYVPIFQNEDHVSINGLTTGIGFMWDKVGFDYDKPKAYEIIKRIRVREEFINFGKLIDVKLNEDIGYLMGAEILETNDYKLALGAFKEEIRKEPEWFYLRKGSMMGILSDGKIKRLK